MTRINGTDYPDGTPQSLIETLEGLRDNQRTRVTILYTYQGGETWEESGYIGRTTGNANYPNGGTRSPLIVHNTRSHVGSLIDLAHVSEIRSSKKTVRRTYYRVLS